MAPPRHPDPDPGQAAKPRAIETAGIGPALRRRRTIAAVLMVVAVAVGITAWIVYPVLDRHYLAKQDAFARYPGTITEVRDLDSDDSSGEVDVHFGPGQRFRTTIHVGNTGSWRDGQSVTVLVDPERNTTTLPGENYKPEAMDAMFGLLGLACVGTLIGSSVWFARNRARQRRSRASAWRTVDAEVVASRGESGEKTVVYIPEFSTDQLWLVKGRIRGPKTRVQIAGERHGLVVRLGEDGSLMLAEPNRLTAPVTARVTAYDERDGELAFRLDAGDTAYFVSGSPSLLVPDVGDLDAVRAATIRLGSGSVVLVQLGLSKQPIFFTRVTDQQARKRWPRLVNPS